MPGFNTDIKVTSSRQPQSSLPFVSFRQKIEGLGYDLLLFVYDKLDEPATSTVSFPAVRLIPAALTADLQTTRELREIVGREGNADDVLAFLVERKIPVDEATLQDYAAELVASPPAQGLLTISNALQWRLQYGRVVAGGQAGVTDVL